MCTYVCTGFLETKSALIQRQEAENQEPGGEVRFKLWVMARAASQGEERLFQVAVK